MKFLLKDALLRLWSIQDAHSLAKHANNEKIAANLRDGFPHPYTEVDAKNWLKNAIIDKNLLLAIEVNGEAVGGIGVIYKEDVYRKSAEIGYWLSESYWNKGIISEAIKILTEYTFANSDIVRFYAGIFDNNPASAQVLQKAGFFKEAVHKNAVIKKGVLMDEIIFAKLK